MRIGIMQKRAIWWPKRGRYSNHLDQLEILSGRQASKLWSVLTEWVKLHRDHPPHPRRRAHTIATCKPTAGSSTSWPTREMSTWIRPTSRDTTARPSLTPPPRGAP